MLNPNDRSLLIDAVRPPAGYRFVAGVALTYTLDLTTLLTIPLHLAVLSSGRREELLKDPVAMLEALRRTSSKLAIVCQHGRIAVPNLPHVLYGLLERSVVEVNAPHGGVFHPKLWSIEYENVESGGTLIRLIVLSRNLTQDHCWDLSLVLEGIPGGRAIAANRPIANLLELLRDWTAGPLSEEARQVLVAMTGKLARTKWTELPEEFENVQFHVLGLDKKPWKPERSDRLAVISPFVRQGALELFLDSTENAVALISRPEELGRIGASTLSRFRRCLTLLEQAETEDGEDVSATPSAVAHLTGLHAKAYITERSWYTTLYLGSANATNASLLVGGNVEVLVELTGKTTRVGGIKELLGKDNFGNYLTEFVPPAEPPSPSVEEEAEGLLNAAREAIAGAGLHITFERNTDDAFYYLIQSERPPVLQRVAQIHLWPITVPAERAVDAITLTLTDGSVRMGPLAAASLTAFVAFEIKTDLCDLSISFVLNLPVANMPVLRDAAVLRMIVANREGFLRYLLLLLREDGQPALLNKLAESLRGSGPSWRQAMEELPLLEELTRAFSRDPQRLHAIRRMVEQLTAAPNGHEIVPPEFLEVWQVYQSMLSESDQPAGAKDGVDV